MDNLKNFLFELIDLPGVTGFEEPIRQRVMKEWDIAGFETKTGKTGALIANKKSIKGGEAKNKVMIAAHMDAIGMVVRSIRGDFIQCAKAGGIDDRVIPGTPIVVYATKGRSSPEPLEGYICMPHPKSLPPENNEGLITLDKLLIDVGLTNFELKEKVNIGDVVAFNSKPFELNGKLVCGHSIDNRASVTAVTAFMKNLREVHSDWEVYCVATSGEEENFNGAITASYEVNPNIAIVLDVTFGKGPGSSDWQTFEIGKGITIGFGPNLHPKFSSYAQKIAERYEIPYSLEILPAHSGTDAYAVQIAREGIPTILIEIPVRYMHSAAEVVSLNDIERAGRLVGHLVNSLDEKTLSKISWEVDNED